MQSRNKDPLLIGISGRSGAGKTYLLDLLAAHLGDRVCILSQDHYYFPLESQQRDAQGEVNFDLPTALDNRRFLQDLRRLINGEIIQVREYTFNNPARESVTLTLRPAPVILVEGLFIFCQEEIRRLLACKVFLEADESTALTRRLERDFRERAYPEIRTRYQWENHVLPAYRKFIEPYKKEADLIIRNNASEPPDLEPLLAWVAARLNPNDSAQSDPDRRF